MASPALTLSNDRPVGGLDHLPLPPHHSTPTQQRLFRSDSDVSQSSTASSVPRSSSFTRSKRFLTGDGLSAREALGIIDQPNATAVEANSISRLHDFHLARAAVHAVLGHGPSAQPRPPPPPPHTQISAHILRMITETPPPKPPPPPPLPRQPLLSRLVFGDEDINVTPPPLNNHDTAASVQSSPSPQSPESISSPPDATAEPIKMHPFSMSSAKIATPEKPKRRMRRILSSTGIRQKHPKTANASSPRLQMSHAAPDTAKTKSSSETQPIPRSKTFARLLAFFSSPGAPSVVDIPSANSKDPEIVPAEDSDRPKASTNQSKATTRAEARSVPSLRAGDRSDPITPISQIQESGQPHQLATKPEKVSGAHGDDKENAVYISDEDSSLSNIADLLVNERPLFTRESQSASNSAESEENTEPTEDADKNPVATAGAVAPGNSSSGKRVETFSGPVQNAVSAPMHGDHPLTTHVKPGVAPQKVDPLPQRKASHKKLHGVSVKIENPMSPDRKTSPTKEKLGTPRKERLEAPKKEKLGAVQSAIRKFELIEKNAARSFTKGVASEQCTMTADDNLSFTSAAEDCVSVNEAQPKGKSSSKVPQDDAENETENSPQPSIESPTVESVTTSSSGNSRADRYCDHPGALLNGSDTYRLRAGDKVKFPDSRAHDISRPLSQFGLPMLHYDASPGVNAHDFLEGPIASAMAEEGTDAQRNRRDSHAAFLRSDQHPAANETHSEKVNGIENEPSVGETTEQTRKGVRKTKSGLGQRIAATAKKIPRGASFPRLRSWGDQQASDGKPSAMSSGLSKNGSNDKGCTPDVQDVGKTSDSTATPKEQVLTDFAREKPNRKGPKIETTEREASETKQERTNEGPTFGSSKNGKGQVGSKSSAKKKPHEDMLCISKLEDRNFGVGNKHEKRDIAYRRALPRPKTIAHGMPTGSNQVALSVKGTAQETAKLSTRSTKDVMGMGEKAWSPTAESAKVWTAESTANSSTLETGRKEIEMLSSKDSSEPTQDNLGSEVGKSRDDDMVTIERVIRRIKADGSSETIRKKIRLPAERVLPNGDVVVRRTLQRLKEDGSGSETVTISQIIPRRQKPGAARVKEDEPMEGYKAGCVGTSLPDLETAKMEMETKKGGLQAGAENDGADRFASRPGEGIMEGKVSAGNRKDGKLGSGGWGRMWSFQGKDGLRKRFWRR